MTLKLRNSEYTTKVSSIMDPIEPQMKTFLFLKALRSNKLQKQGS